MALSPYANKNTIDRIKQVSKNSAPSLTYEYDFDTQEFTGQLIDKAEALKQFVRKALSTARFRHLIYSSNYGCEVEDLMGEDVSAAFLDSEIPRLITEALIYDERIKSVFGFGVAKDQSSDKVFASFKIEAADGFILNVQSSESYEIALKPWSSLNGVWANILDGTTWIFL
jgi:phage baseplate assembly protein W